MASTFARTVHCFTFLFFFYFIFCNMLYTYDEGWLLHHFCDTWDCVPCVAPIHVYGRGEQPRPLPEGYQARINERAACRRVLGFPHFFLNLCGGILQICCIDTTTSQCPLSPKPHCRRFYRNAYQLVLLALVCHYHQKYRPVPVPHDF